MSDLFSALHGATAAMSGIVYRQPDGRWFFVRPISGLRATGVRLAHPR